MESILLRHQHRITATRTPIALIIIPTGGDFIQAPSSWGLDTTADSDASGADSGNPELTFLIWNIESAAFRVTRAALLFEASGVCAAPWGLCAKSLLGSPPPRCGLGCGVPDKTPSEGTTFCGRR